MKKIISKIKILVVMLIALTTFVLGSNFAFANSNTTLGIKAAKEVNGDLGNYANTVSVSNGEILYLNASYEVTGDSGQTLKDIVLSFTENYNGKAVNKTNQNFKFNFEGDSNGNTINGSDSINVTFNDNSKLSFRGYFIDKDCVNNSCATEGNTVTSYTNSFNMGSQLVGKKDSLTLAFDVVENVTTVEPEPETPKSSSTTLGIKAAKEVNGDLGNYANTVSVSNGEILYLNASYEVTGDSGQTLKDIVLSFTENYNGKAVNKTNQNFKFNFEGDSNGNTINGSDSINVTFNDNSKLSFRGYFIDKDCVNNSCATEGNTVTSYTNSFNMGSQLVGKKDSLTLAFDVVENTTTTNPDTTAPIIAQVTAVPTPTTYNTPSYTFSSNEAGTISYEGTCKSDSTNNAINGNNVITFTTLPVGTYSDCKIKVTDASGNVSETLDVNTFTIISGNGEDTTAPTIAQVTAVPTPTTDTTPSYTFSSNEAGTISYEGSCASATTNAVNGNNNIITFNTLPEGTYSDCKIKVTDASGNVSETLDVNTFTISATTTTSGGDGGTGTIYNCRDEKALNYKTFGTSKESLCEYKETTDGGNGSGNTTINNYYVNEKTPEVSTPQTPNTTTITRVNYRYVGIDFFKDILLEADVSDTEEGEYGLKSNAQAGEDFFYRYTITNNSDEEKEGFKVLYTVPEEFELKEINEDTSYNSETRELVWFVGDLNPNQSKTYIMKLEVLENVENQTIITFSEVEYNEAIAPTNSVRVNITDEIVNTQGAFLFGINWVLPETAFGWLWLLLILILIAYLIGKILNIRYGLFFFGGRRKKEENR